VDAAIDINNSDSSDDPKINFQLTNVTTFSIGVDNADSTFKIGTTAPATGTAVTVQSTGEVGIGTTSPTTTLHVDGDGIADGASILTITSDGDRDFEIRNPVDGDLNSPWQFYSSDAYEFIVYEPSGALSTINIEADADVRIESDNNVNMLFVDYSADAVGIGTASPDVNLDVKNSSTAASVVTVAKFTADAISTTSAGAEILLGGGDYSLRGVTIGGVCTNGVDNRHDMILSTSAAASVPSERMRITYEGNVGIGTSSPANLVTIGSVATSGQDGIMIEDPSAPTYGAYFHYDDANTQVKIGGVTAGTYNSTIVIPRDNNRVGIGRTPATNALEVNGDASKTSSGDWLANSDARLKKEIKQMDSQTVLDKMLALKGVTYYWNDTVTGSKRPTQLQYGFTAQNIQEVFPILVEEDNLGYLQTAYGTYDAMYVESMRALQEQIDSQQVIIEAQKKEIATEKAENESQKQEIETIKAEASSSSVETNQKLKDTAQKLAALEAKLNALLLLNSKGAVLTAEN
jgi:hypothetical protein